jgi:hypothetical protein
MARDLPGDDWDYLVLDEEKMELERSLESFPMPAGESPINLDDYLEDGHIYPIALDEIEIKLVQYLKQQDVA